MALIKSISGIRGTIGGKPGSGLSPVDVVRFTSGYGAWLKASSSKSRLKVVVGRDARPSGEMVQNLVVGTLQGLGIDVINLGLASTPTTELALLHNHADGGIIITASHNPKNWNALKLLNREGEFLSASDGDIVLKLAEAADFNYENVDDLGQVTEINSSVDMHINHVLSLNLVDTAAISEAGFKVVVDGVNSVGGIIVPALLKALGVAEVVEIFCTPNGQFPHDPEPLPGNLIGISDKVKEVKADVGFAVDPDVDRLAIINEDGSMFGEEYTLVAVADYVLARTPGATVSNLSSTRALSDVASRYGMPYHASAVGEVNVVEKMRETKAVIGGEGNGGVIYPASHSGRDALVGIALFLTHLAKSGLKCSALREKYPSYYMSKNKLELGSGTNVDAILLMIKEHYKHERVTDVDGVKIDFKDSWVHLRKSNTEPIIRIYSEARSENEAEALASEIINIARSLA